MNESCQECPEHVVHCATSYAEAKNTTVLTVTIADTSWSGAHSRTERTATVPVDRVAP